MINFDDKEVWIALPTHLEAFSKVFPGAYMVSNYGRIRGARASTKTADGCLATSVGLDGQCCTTLCGPNNYRRKFVVKYIILCSFDPRPDHMLHRCVNLNGDNGDNRLCNLAWDDYTRFGKFVLCVPTPTISTLPGEIWRPMVSICDLADVEALGYFISNKGRIFHTFHNYLGYGVDDCKAGYYILRMNRFDGTLRRLQVHRIVMCIFEPRPDFASLQVNHKNGDKKDNRYPENLEWVTPKENIHHAYTNNLTYMIGQDHTESKYETEIVFRIMDLHLKELQTGQIVDKLALDNVYVSNDFVSDVKCCRTRVSEIVQYLINNGITPRSVLSESEIDTIINMTNAGSKRNEILKFFNVQFNDIKGVVISVISYIARLNGYSWIKYL